MQYAALVYHEEEKMRDIPVGELEEIIGACSEWVRELENNGQHIFSSALQCPSTAMTARTKNGKLVSTDGPFAETKEFLGGLTIFEARDFNEALQIVNRMPANRIGSVELRPAFDFDSEMPHPVDRKIVAGVRKMAHQTTGVKK